MHTCRVMAGLKAASPTTQSQTPNPEAVMSMNPKPETTQAELNPEP